MITDRIFISTIRKAIEAHSLVAPTYAYIFDYKGKYNLGTLFGASESEWGKNELIKKKISWIIFRFFCSSSCACLRG
jgi:hypothetical protein